MTPCITMNPWFDGMSPCLWDMPPSAKDHWANAGEGRAFRALSGSPIRRNSATKEQPDLRAAIGRRTAGYASSRTVEI
jgi:hypothetical protein